MRYVIAVGGNALKNSKVLNKLSAYIARLSGLGNEIVVTHGNGPQVGKLALHNDGNLALLTKETEAEIGSMIRKSIARANRKLGSSTKIVYTRVLVDKNDPNFKNPTKPIGRFYSRAEAEKLAERGFVMKPLLKGYRRVVASPKPLAILDVAEVRRLLKEAGIVIAAGGGGIAVARSGNRLRYMDAVIDKDLASSLLAVKLRADRFVILTDVDGVVLGYHTGRSRLLRRVSAPALMAYAITEHFEAGSMLPKVMACIGFVRRTHGRAAIGNLNKADRVLSLRDATVVTPG